MTLIDMEKYSNKQLVFFFTVFGIVMGTILFVIDVKPALLFLISSIILCLPFLKNVWFWFILFLGSLPFNSFLAVDIGVPIRISYILFFVLFTSLVYTVWKQYQKQEITKGVIFSRCKTPFDMTIVLVLLIIALSIFQSQYILPNSPVTGDTLLNYPWIKSITKSLLLGVLLLMFYITVFMLDTKEKLKRSIFWYGVFVCIYSMCGLISYVLFLTGYHVNILDFEPIIQHDPSAGIPRLRSVAEEPLFFGFYVLMSLFIMMKVWFDHVRKKENVSHPRILLASIALIILALSFTLSRSAGLGFFAGFMFLVFFLCEDIGGKKVISIISTMYALLFRMTKTRRTIIFFAFALFIFLTFYFLVWQVSDAFNPGANRFWSTKTRLITYEQAVSAFLAHPFLGIGYENFNFYSGNKYYKDLVEFNFNWTEVNNYPLKVLAELGIIGFIVVSYLYLKIIIMTLKEIYSAKDHYLQAVLVGSLSTFIATSTILLFSSSIIMPYLWVSAGIHVAALKISQQRE